MDFLKFRDEKKKLFKYRNQNSILPKNKSKCELRPLLMNYLSKDCERRSARNILVIASTHIP